MYTIAITLVVLQLQYEMPFHLIFNKTLLGLLIIRIVFKITEL